MRDRAALLITNPDMLHCSILPVHKSFARLLAHLRYVVVDEGHAYRCGEKRVAMCCMNEQKLAAKDATMCFHVDDVSECCSPAGFHKQTKHPS